MRLNYSPLFLLFPLLAACPDKDPADTDGTSSTGSPTTTDATTTDDATGTGGGTSTPVDDCAFLVGKTFKSDAELECGLGPNGPVLCNWTLSFTADMYMHQYSDLGDSGPYTCEGGVISGQDGFMTPIAATIDGVTGELVWNDVVYHPAP